MDLSIKWKILVRLYTFLTITRACLWKKVYSSIIWSRLVGVVGFVGCMEGGNPQA